MNTSVISKIEESIFALPENEQRRLIARISKSLRKHDCADDDERMIAMANDPLIQREIKEIEREFSGTEMDGLSE
ncbi:MAG: hypothetical protein ACRD6X_14035 [Pyrinomonadaceae bacterium]